METGVDYTITITGANDYDATGDKTVNLTANETRDITVAKRRFIQYLEILLD